MIDRTFLVANWYRKSKPDVVCVGGGGETRSLLEAARERERRARGRGLWAL